MKILIIDNYDSFTYNLLHMVESIVNHKVDVLRNDDPKLLDLSMYDKIILSPGPGIPDESGMLKEVIKRHAPTKSILGVCLGLQAIAEVYGGKLINLSDVYHGIYTEIRLENKKESIYKNIPATIKAGRYHSWIVDRESLPGCFEITADDELGNIMSLSHKMYDVKGVQFHPESILTEYGEQILRNWIYGCEKMELNLPSASNKSFQINQIKTGLLFC